MWRYRVVVILFLAISASAMSNIGRANSVFGKPQPALTDTIYRIDTVYQVEYVYDTLYYYDTIAQTDTLTSVSTLTDESDSTVLQTRVFELLIRQRRTVFAPASGKKETKTEFDLQQPGRNPKAKKPKNQPVNAGTVISETPQEQATHDEVVEQPLGLPYQLKDTLYRVDSIFRYEIKRDTLYFDNRPVIDTAITNRKSYHKLGNAVLAQETVNIKVTRRSNVFVEKPGNKQSDSDQSQKHERRSSSIFTSHSRRSFNNNSRVGSDISYSGSVRLGFSWFRPDLQFSATEDHYRSQADRLNREGTTDDSWGIRLTYNYFRNNVGFETGLGFTKQRFVYNQDVDQLNTDTIRYWDYFTTPAYLHDTVWYINLDTLLLTGDTVMVPHVDSVLTLVTDSLQKTRIDSAWTHRQGAYSYSFSFLEIPIIGHYTLIDKRFFVRVAAGVIPMFLVSKSGSMAYADPETVIPTSDISFDFGFNLSFYGALIMGYRLDERWSLFAEPYVRRNIFSALRNDRIRMKSNAWGVRAGIAYRLFYSN